MHQFGEAAGAAAFQRKGGLLGSLLVEGELGLEGVGVEVAVRRRRFWFRGLGWCSVGFRRWRGRVRGIAGLGGSFSPAGEVARFQSVAATSSELGASVSKIANAC
jgi:hypothetical protein